MKKIFNKLFILASAVFLFALTGCPDGSLYNADKQGGVKIIILDGDKNSRTILPGKPVFTKYELSFEKVGGGEPIDPVIIGDTEGGDINFAEVHNLSAGLWNVTARGFVMISGNPEPQEAASGSGQVDVVPGSTPPLYITISANMDGDNGFFTYNINFPQDYADSATMYFQKLPNLGFDSILIDLIDESKSDQLELPPGYYILSISISNGPQTAATREIVHIYSGMETIANKTFTEADFVKYITLSGTVDFNFIPDNAYVMLLPDNDLSGSYDDIWDREIGGGYVDLDGNSGEWSFEVPAYNSSKSLYFAVFYQTSGGAHGIKGVRFEEIGNQNIPDISLQVDITFITLSGTITVTYNGAAVPYVFIESDYGYYELNYPGTNEPWSMEIEAFTTPTTVSFVLNLYDENWNILEEGYSAGSVANVFASNEGGINLNVGDISSTFEEDLIPSGNTLVHINPMMYISPGATHSTWNGTPSFSTDPFNGNFNISTGGIRYGFNQLNVLSEGSAQYTDYDFVKVFYTASSVNNTVLKQYNSGDDFPAYSGSIANGNGSFELEIAKATSNGFAIQKWSAGSENTNIRITQIIYSKGNRINFTLNYNDDGETSDQSMYLVEGTAVGSLIPVPTRDGYNFMGWSYDGGTSTITSATVVSNSFITLVAQWAEKITLSPMTITFSNVSELTGVGASDIGLDGNGYKFTLTGFQQFVKFSITLDTDVSLADYDKITFTITGSGADFTYKSLSILAADSLPGSLSAQPGDGDSFMVSNETDNYSTGPVTATRTINKGKTAGLKETIEMCIYVHAGHAEGTIYTITDIVLSQD